MESVPTMLELNYYYYYYYYLHNKNIPPSTADYHDHHNYHHPHSLLHSSLASSEKTMDLTNQEVLIHSRFCQELSDYTALLSASRYVEQGRD
jgi:hypothetical protein